MLTARPLGEGPPGAAGSGTLLVTLRKEWPAEHSGKVGAGQQGPSEDELRWATVALTGDSLGPAQRPLPAE